MPCMSAVIYEGSILARFTYDLLLLFHAAFILYLLKSFFNFEIPIAWRIGDRICNAVIAGARGQQEL